MNKLVEYRIVAFLLAGLCIAWVGAMPCGAQSIDIREDFSNYEEGTEPSDPWIADGFSWEVRSGRLRAVCPDFSELELRQRQWFKRMHLEVVLTVHSKASNGWKVAGIGFAHDAERRWHAALIESPDSSGRQHWFEVAMGLPGAWPTTQGVRIISERNTGFDWQYGHPYRIVLQLGDGKLRGALLELDGTLLAEKVCELSPPAVMDGSPSLRCGGFEADFDDVMIQASEYFGSPEAEKMQVPPLKIPVISRVTGRKTGFFHVEEIDGVWWVIEPGGNGFYAIGTDHCRYSGHWCQKLGYAPYGKNTQRIYGSEEAWAETATDRLKRWNFNLLGAGHSYSCRYKGLAHTEFISFGAGYAGYDPLVEKVHWTGFPNVFSKGWERWCDKLAWKICRPNTDDPWLFGYFLDNELEWYGKGGGEVGLAVEAMKLGSDNPAKQAFIELLRTKYGVISQLNRAWGASYGSWEELAEASKAEAENVAALREDQLAYVREVAERYFRVSCEAVRRWDPNHMILGCRFAGDAPPGVWEAAGKYCDIVTFNYYGRVDILRAEAPGTAERWTEYYRKARRPLMITEWSFPALDSGLPCKHGAGMRVDTQAQKSLCYEVYQRTAFSLPFMVGSDYFMWVDEPALGISDTFPEDSNYGLVNEEDVPYELLTQTAERVNALAYELHSGNVPEVEVARVELRDGKIQAQVANTGRQAARLDVAFSVGGQEIERTSVRLAPGQTSWVRLGQKVAPPAYITVVADPERRLAEKNHGNNRCGYLYYKPAPWPPAPAGKWITRWPVLVTAEYVDRPAGAVVTVSGEMLKEHGQASDLGRRLAAYDSQGNRIACQLEAWPDEWQIAMAMEPARSSTGQVIYLYLADSDLPQANPGVSLQIDGLQWRADNGEIELEGTAKGNVVDSVSFQDTPMGWLNPLVWERRRNQDLWTQTVRTREVLAFNGPVRAAVQVWCESEPEQASITAVDEAGRMEGQRAAPHHFLVAHRMWVVRGQAWFADQFISLRNLGSDEMEVRGWFYFLLSAIGGDAKDDIVGGPGVPAYWLNLGAWQDEPSGLVLGAVPVPDERIATHFWKDAGGGQHPDLRRVFEPAVRIGPGQERREEPEAPPALIFAGPSSQGPWQQAGEIALALGHTTTRVLPAEKP